MPQSLTACRYAFRFFVAFFETAWVPVSYFLMGSWYTKSELAKRSGIFYVAGRYAFRFFVRSLPHNYSFHYSYSRRFGFDQSHTD